MLPNLLQHPTGVKSKILIFKIRPQNLDDGFSANGGESLPVLPRPTMRHVRSFFDRHLSI